MSRISAWVRDLALAYAAGLVFGAPLALVAVWLTGRTGPVTPLILLCMVVALLWRRRAVARVRSKPRPPVERHGTANPRKQDCRVA